MPSPGVAAVDRASTILAAFEGEPTPPAWPSSPGAPGCTRARYFRLMASLQELGYLVQPSDGRGHLSKGNIRTMSSLLLKAAVRLARSLGGPAELMEAIRRSKVMLQRCDHLYGAENKSKRPERALCEPVAAGKSCDG